MKIKGNIIIIIILLLLAPSANSFAQSSDDFLKGSKEFNTMWWLGSINNQKKYDFAIQTSIYGLVFDYNNLNFSSLWLNDKFLQEDDFLNKPSNEILKTNDGSDLKFGIKSNNGQKTVMKASGNLKNCQLITSGRYTNKRFINELVGNDNQDKIMSGLEVYTHVNNFNLIYKYTCSKTTNNLNLYLDYKFPDNFNNVKQLKSGHITISEKGSKSGFVVLPSSGTTKITLQDNEIHSETLAKKCKAKDEFEVGLVIYAFLDLKQGLNQLLSQNQIEIKATSIEPSKLDLNCQYNNNENTYNIEVHIPRPEGAQKSKNNEKVVFELTNNMDVDRSINLNFFKNKYSSSITGISGVICDLENNPTGLAVQISKNWHKDKNIPQRYEGSWIDMYTTINIPAKTTVKYIYNCITSYWGTLPAVSHAQLSLVGWGSSVQLWDQSALGSWGESICYSPDGNVGNANITDVRPAMVKNAKGEDFKWGGNIGGGDFINITDSKGERMHHENIRIQRVRYAPNLTEMTYYGDIANGAASFEYTIMLSRTNDMVKGRYNIKLKVNKDFSFSNFALFSAGAYRYAFSQSEHMAIGNSEGLIKEWQLYTSAERNKYIGDKFTIDGKNTWVAQSKTTITSAVDKLSANRGLILREWDAKITGKHDTEPYWGEFMVERNKSPRSIINLSVPNDCYELKAGDYINASLDMIIYQKQAEDYCADNEHFKQALASHPDSWEIVWREAKDNHYTVTLTTGEIINNRPIKIKTANNKAQGKIEGGLAYEPITFTNLSSYANPVLYIKDKNKWKEVNQSKNGKDFWQCDYNSEYNYWEITYNIPLDKSNERATEFKFELR